MKWHERGYWLAPAVAGYMIALLAKETAVLLPIVLLLMTPPGSTRSQRERIVAMLGFGAALTLALLLRFNAGALMPNTDDAHYDLDFSAYRVARSLEVYLPRAMPAPLAMILMAAIAARFGSVRSLKANRRVITAGAAWFLLFLAPVLPIVARNELYLYLPAWGLCLIAGTLADQWMAVASPRRAMTAIAIFAAAFAVYQRTRDARAHEVQAFTAGLMNAVHESAWLRSAQGDVRFTTDNAESRQLMSEGVGGYINGLTQLALPARTFGATVEYGDAPANGSQVHYRFIDGRVELEH